MVGLLSASMALGMMGCKGKPPEPPVSAGGTIQVANGAGISVDSFQIAKPDFLDANGRAAHPAAGQESVAILRLKITNNSSGDLNYRPLHFADVKGRVQLCTDPNPDTGDRANIRAIGFDAAAPYHTRDQKIDSVVTIPAGQSITDDYLFEPPAEKGDLVVLIPDSIVGGGDGKVLRMFVHEATQGTEAKVAGLKDAVSIDGMTMTVTSVTKEYAELVPKTAPSKPLKYAYAYTKEPVLAVRVTIKNTDSKPHSYDPAHNSATAGISFKFAGKPLERVKFDNAYGKGQVTGPARAIDPDTSIDDVYFFSVPGNDSRCEFEVSGNVLSVSGVYRYAFDISLRDPAEPDLKPYLRGDAAAAGADDGAENGDEAGDDEGGEGAEGEEDGADEGAAEAPAEGEAKAE